MPRRVTGRIDRAIVLASAIGTTVAAVWVTGTVATAERPEPASIFAVAAVAILATLAVVGAGDQRRQQRYEQAARRQIAEATVQARIDAGLLVKTVGGGLVPADEFDPARHVRADGGQ